MKNLIITILLVVLASMFVGCTDSYSSQPQTLHREGNPIVDYANTLNAIDTIGTLLGR